MKRFVTFGVLVALAGCGPASQTEGDAGVKSTPLAGTVNGQPWTAASATASAHKAFGDGGEKWLDVGSTAFTCSTFIPDAQLIGVVPWQVGTYPLSLSRNLTLVTRSTDGGSTMNNVAISGRVEILSAPDAGVATMRIRATANSQNTVEGQLDVQVCD